MDPALLFAALQVIPIEWRLAADYADRRQDAEQRIAARDPDDWPTVALALTLDLPVWSQDKDLASAGLRVKSHRWRHPNAASDDPFRQFENGVKAGS